jgi:FtsH-binding integral membrane protein
MDQQMAGERWDQGGKINTLESTEVSDQMKFVRKVYTILAIQLTITAGWVAIV